MNNEAGQSTYGQTVPTETYRVPDPRHPQVSIYPNGPLVDEKIAPLVAQVRKHGLMTQWSCQGGDEGVWELAYLTFPILQDGLEFLEQTMFNLDFRFEDQIALTIVRPMGLNEGKPGAKVTWTPGLTRYLVDAWCS